MARKFFRAIAIAIPGLAILLAVASPLPEIMAIGTAFGAALVILIALPLAAAVFLDKSIVRQALYLVGIVALSYWSIKHTTNFGSMATARVNHVTKAYRLAKPKDYTWHEWRNGRIYRYSVQSPGVLRLDIDRNSFMLDTGDQRMMGGQDAYIHIRTYLPNESPSPDDLRTDQIFGGTVKEFTRDPFKIMFVAWKPFPPDLFDEFAGQMFASLKIEPIEYPSGDSTDYVSSGEAVSLRKGVITGYRCQNSRNVDKAVTLIFNTLDLDPAQGRLKVQVTYHQWTKEFAFTTEQPVDVFGFDTTLSAFESGAAKLSIKDSGNRYGLYEKATTRP